MLESTNDVAEETSDFDVSQLVPLSQVPKLFPKRPNGKTVHLSRVYVWILKGCRGTKLRAVRLPSGWHVHPAWVQDFIFRLSNPSAPATVRTSCRRQRAVERAERQLVEAEL